jgi:hypothetical protein
MAAFKLVPSTICHLVPVLVFVLLLPAAEASWWHDPYVLANYSLLDANVKKILPEEDFRPLADFFIGAPAAATLFGETPELRHRLKSNPRWVSALVQACAQLEQLRLRMVAIPEAERWRLGPEVSSLFEGLCAPKPDTFAKYLQQCPDIAYWRRGLVAAKYNGSVSAAPSAPAAFGDSQVLRRAVAAPFGSGDEKLMSIAASLDSLTRLLVGLICMVVAAGCGAVAIAYCYRPRKNKEEEDGSALPANFFFWKKS